MKEGEDAIKMIQEALDMVGKHQPLRSSVVKHEEHANGGVGHHQNPSPSSDASKPVANNDFISQDGSEKNEAQMPSELVTSCVASWLMIQVIRNFLGWICIPNEIIWKHLMNTHHKNCIIIIVLH